MDGPATEERHHPDPQHSLTDSELRAWVEATTGGQITDWSVISGGNRCRSWAVDCKTPDGSTLPLYLRYQPPRPPSSEPYTVWREAKVYGLLGQTSVRAPRLIAAHAGHPAILTERVPGRADFRRIGSDAEKTAIARDFVAALATLHATPVDPSRLSGGAADTIADCVRTEIAIWRAMYDEAKRRDPLIEFALDWLSAHVPTPAEAPVLVHGDAGQGNFLFENGKMTALLDWELSHPGDPMEDLAWFSMRSVMEPVPDFTDCLRAYAKASGRAIDVGRILYHRVFVSARVVIIRHRNITGEPGNSIVSRALNRRLLVDALAAANGKPLPAIAPLHCAPTAQTALYDGVISNLQDDIAAGTKTPGVIAAAKNAAKVVKYLREIDRLGPSIAQLDKDALASLPGVAGADDPDAALCDAILAQAVPFDTALRFFAGRVAREAQLAAPSSGGLATRSFPDLHQGAF